MTGTTWSALRHSVPPRRPHRYRDFQHLASQKAHLSPAHRLHEAAAMQPRPRKRSRLQFQPPFLAGALGALSLAGGGCGAIVEDGPAGEDGGSGGSEAQDGSGGLASCPAVAPLSGTSCSTQQEGLQCGVWRPCSAQPQVTCEGHLAKHESHVQPAAQRVHVARGRPVVLPAADPRLPRRPAARRQRLRLPGNRVRGGNVQRHRPRVRRRRHVAGDLHVVQSAAYRVRRQRWLGRRNGTALSSFRAPCVLLRFRSHDPSAPQRP